MEDGVTLRFTDEWDSLLEFEEFVRDGLLGRSRERDLARAAGKTNLLSIGTFTAMAQPIHRATAHRPIASVAESATKL